MDRKPELAGYFRSKSQMISKATDPHRGFVLRSVVVRFTYHSSRMNFHLERLQLSLRSLHTRCNHLLNGITRRAK